MLDLFYMDVCCDCSKEQSLALYEMLSADRKHKADRLKNKDMGRKQIVTGAFLQYILSKYTQIPISLIEFEYNADDKPSVKNADVYFNMSHSGQYAVVAVSDHEVGIDIEKKKSGRISVAKRCFCKEEYEDILNAKDEDGMTERFLEYWTLKEAYVKYIGKGLSLPFNSFLIKRGLPGEYSVIDENRKTVPELFSFSFSDEYRISICCDGLSIMDFDDPKEQLSNVQKIELLDILIN